MSAMSRLIAIINSMLGLDAASRTHAADRGAHWTIFSGTMIFGGRQLDR
jgi:hypothetical protein